jgi:acetamidase/formamidase
VPFDTRKTEGLYIRQIYDIEPGVVVAEYRLDATDANTVVGVFDQARPPVMSIGSGDMVDIETNTHWGNAIFPETTLEDIIRLRTEVYPDVGPHTLTGPVEITGAKVGRILKVEILELVPRTHGFNIFYPGAFGTGLLPEDFDEGEVRHFEHDLEAMTTAFSPNINIPLKPFLGIMGVAPPDPGPHSTVPPGPYGGNMDLPDLIEGTTAYFPIWNDGAQFSIGDAHSKQGNGEVCLTAIETAFRHSRLRFTVVEDRQVERPFAETPDTWITMGFDEDLLVAAKTALRDMIALLHSQYGLSAGDAYSLCSITSDLSVTQVVNRSRGVHVSIPKALFAG